ncbi:hypothetical protein [Streptomyces sp. NPDC029003]
MANAFGYEQGSSASREQQWPRVGSDRPGHFFRGQILADST